MKEGSGTAMELQSIRLKETENCDLLIVGGGITGAGIALDAVSRGLRTILIEKHDFASKTSSASSKLIHGGLRYLKNRDFRLVFEALHERGMLLKLAPDIVKPMPFLIPVYDKKIKNIKKIIVWLLNHEKTTMFDLMKAPLGLRSALLLYDILSGKEKIKRHRMLSSEEITKLEPMLRKENLSSGAVYYDAFGIDFRLTLSIIKRAISHGAKCINYAELISFIKENRRIKGAIVRDKIEGNEARVYAKKICLAGGPWNDMLREKATFKEETLKLVKGSHIIISREKLRINHAIVMEARDKRLTFAIPWDSIVIAGTTEVELEKPEENIKISEEEIEYLLEVLNRYFPEAGINRGDIISTYAGIRPLIKAGAFSPSDISREHKIFEEKNLITISGGKLTTYRVMAKQVVDIICRELGINKECRTEKIKLKESVKLGVKERGIAEGIIDYYSEDEINEILEMIKHNPELAKRIGKTRHILAEVDFAIKNEFALTLDDILKRRLGIFFSESARDEKAINEVAERAAKLLGWDEDEKNAQIKEYFSSF